VTPLEEILDRLIERRAREREEADRVHAEWAQSCRTFDLRAQAERRRAWVAYHQDLARLHSQFAAEHEEKALRLIDEGAC
jgi:hypothetical protein